MLNNLNDLEKLYNNNMIKSVLNTFSYAPNWFTLVDTIDGNLRARYGNRGLLEYYTRTDENDVKTDFETILYVYLKSREKEYARLYDLIDLEYNPIENYSMEENESGFNTSDNMYGDITESNNSVFGERKTDNTLSHGKVTDTETLDIGEITTISNGEDKRAPFDDNEYENVTKADGTSTTDARTDKSTSVRDGYEDKNTFSEDEHIDSNMKHISEHGDTFHTDFTRTLTRSGNIGVTTSQQMIESSINLAPKFNLVDRISRDVANLVSKGVYYVL